MTSPFSRSYALRTTAVLLVLSTSFSALAAPVRAAAIVAAAAGKDPATRARIAEAALLALDGVQGVTPIRTEALRRALVPAQTSAPGRVDFAAEAFALAAAAPALAAQNKDAAAALYERALDLVFEKLPVERARAWLQAHGAEALAALNNAGRATPARRQRLAAWQDSKPRPPLQTGTLRVAPANARVFLNGAPLGVGPAVALSHGRGEHDLRVEADGHQGVHRRITLADAPLTLDVVLDALPSDGTDDVRALASALLTAPASPAEQAPRIQELARRLDVGLVFITQPDDTGALVRLYDVEAEAFVGASPVAASDGPTLTRAFRALLELRGTGEQLVGTVGRKTKGKKRRRPGVMREPFWKKWWVWTLVLGGAAVAVGAVLLTRQNSDDGTLTIRLRRAP